MAISKIENASLASGVPQRSQLPAGTVLQVVTGTLNQVFSTTSSTFVSTGLTATITPTSTTNKIFVVVSDQAYCAANAQAVVTLYRNGSNLSAGGFTVAYVGSQAFQASLGFSYLDSPTSTSAQTYTVYIGNSNGTQNIYFNTNAYPTTAIGSITLMEIAA